MVTVRLGPWHFAFLGLLVGAAIATGVALTVSGGASDTGQDGRLAKAETPASTATAVPPTPTIVPAQPPSPQGGAPPEPVPRADCAAIRGTGYQNDAERAFFLANCVTSNPPLDPASSARLATPTVRPTSQPAAPTSEEARYRSQAVAQLAYVSARLAQFTRTPSYGFYNDVLELGSVALNEANALHAIEPAPPRFRAAHNALINALLNLHDWCKIVSAVQTRAQFDAWLDEFDLRVEAVAAATDDFNLVVGISLPAGGLR
jgi:hypothetical protein